MKQELFSMFTKMEHWKDRGGLLTQAAPTPAGRQAVLRHVKELLTHYTSHVGDHRRDFIFWSAGVCRAWRDDAGFRGTVCLPARSLRPVAGIRSRLGRVSD